MQHALYIINAAVLVLLIWRSQMLFHQSYYVIWLEASYDKINIYELEDVYEEFKNVYAELKEF